MTRNADYFVFTGQNTLQNKMFYIISCLDGDAVGYVQPHVAENLSCVNLKSWKSIINVLKLAYANADPKNTAQRSLISLYQTNKRFKQFWAEFHRLTQKAGMDLETTLEYLKDCLSNEIKNWLVNINNTHIDLATFVKVVQGISTKLEILGKNWINANLNTNCTNNVTKPLYHQLTNRIAFIPFTTITTTTLLSSTAIGTHSGPIDMSYADKQKPLTVEKKKRQNKLGLCRYCGQPGHMAKDHNNTSTLQAKRHAAGIHAMAIASWSPKNMSSLENMSSLSIVALRDLLD